MDIKTFNQTIIDEFRANAGRLGGQFAGAPMLLLTTTGAKSGATRVNPLAYLVHGGRHVVIASYAGADTSPPWYHNLVANPQVQVEVGAESYRARAEVLGEPLRSTLYAQMVKAMPVFADYQSRTKRVIPVIALSRLG